MADDPFINKKLGGCRILEKLGEGGMGFAYKAHHDRLDRTVVLKILRPELASDTAFVESFLREARAAAKLEHRGIVQVYDQGSEGGWHFIIMQFIDGETLEDRIKAKGRMAPVEAIPIIKSVFEGLAEAHSRGIVHRDIKPSNIMLAKDGGVKLADFGLAAPVGNGIASTAGQGTPDYMPPEQAWGGDIDARADLYTMGGTLYHMLTGEPPYSGRTPADVISQHREAPVPDVRDHVPGTSKEAAELVLKLLAKSPDDRFVNVEEVLKELNSASVVFGDDDMFGELDMDLGDALTTQPMPRRITQQTPLPEPQEPQLGQSPPASVASSTPMLPLAASTGLALAAGGLGFVGGHSGNMVFAGGAALFAAGAWRFAPHQAGGTAMVLVAIGVGLLHAAGLLTQKVQAGTLTAALGAGAAPWLTAGLLFGWGAFALALDDKKTKGDRVLLVVLLLLSVASWHWFGLPGGSPLTTLASVELRWPGTLVLLGISLGFMSLVHVVSSEISESLSDILFPLFLILAAAGFSFLSGALHHTSAANPPSIGNVLARPFALCWKRLLAGDGLAVMGLLFLISGLGPMLYRVLVRPER
ncbi:MAG: hypothetical protein COB53_05445 [Elusimicrobia bacterium]|nr:MAG: hypothetical protein COB53_05445 [Elusimicrobiota bacterium]